MFYNSENTNIIQGASGIEYSNNAANDDSLEGLHIAGPLNLNRQTKQADTVMGTILPLDEKEFATLDMLAENEGEWLTFEQIYSAFWVLDSDTDNRDAARTGLDNVVRLVSSAGEGFMWIDYKQGDNYTFRTRWGHNWH